MKTSKIRLRLLITLWLVLFLASCTKSPDELLIGEWSGSDPTGKSDVFIFFEDGSAKVIHKNTVIDGSSIGGKVTWRLDDSHDPMFLDLVASNSSGELEVLPAIIRFLGENKIQLRITTDRQTRPVKFISKPAKFMENHIYQMILVRQ